MRAEQRCQAAQVVCHHTRHPGWPMTGLLDIVKEA
jgi:hypothetical protein